MRLKQRKSENSSNLVIQQKRIYFLVYNTKLISQLLKSLKINQGSLDGDVVHIFYKKLNEP